jgi:putative Mg2+ transporter-C (MgtC) family protein
MNPITDELFSLPEAGQTLAVIIRLVAAALLGAIVGAEREAEGKAAGLRTHMLVALGAALFVIAPRQAGLALSEMSRVVQGVAAGIGFIGAGTILKLPAIEEIRGLTTAAGLWLTAAVGVAAGIGPLWVACTCALCAWVTLHLVGRIAQMISPDKPTK